MICPLSITNPAITGTDGIGRVQCDEQECAWWNTYKGCCGMLGALKDIASALDAIEDRMPS